MGRAKVGRASAGKGGRSSMLSNSGLGREPIESDLEEAEKEEEEESALDDDCLGKEKEEEEEEEEEKSAEEVE